MADEIQQLVPDARILIGHGQMADGEMEDAMMKFIRHEADILVCTTIIESGIGYSLMPTRSSSTMRIDLG